MNNQDKFENYMNNVFAPWAVRVVLGMHWVAFMVILGDLAFGKN